MEVRAEVQGQRTERRDTGRFDSARHSTHLGLLVAVLFDARLGKVPDQRARRDILGGKETKPAPLIRLNGIQYLHVGDHSKEPVVKTSTHGIESAAAPGGRPQHAMWEQFSLQLQASRDRDQTYHVTPRDQPACPSQRQDRRYGDARTSPWRTVGTPLWHLLRAHCPVLLLNANNNNNRSHNRI